MRSNGPETPQAPQQPGQAVQGTLRIGQVQRQNAARTQAARGHGQRAGRIVEVPDEVVEADDLESLVRAQAFREEPVAQHHTHPRRDGAGASGSMPLAVKRVGSGLSYEPAVACVHIQQPRPLPSGGGCRPRTVDEVQQLFEVLVP